MGYEKARKIMENPGIRVEAEYVKDVILSKGNSISWGELKELHSDKRVSILEEIVEHMVEAGELFEPETGFLGVAWKGDDNRPLGSPPLLSVPIQSISVEGF